MTITVTEPSIIQDIFKISILSVQLDLDVKSIETFCMKHKISNDGRKRSNIGGYQSNALDIGDKYLKPLVKEINKHSKIMTEQYAIDKECYYIDMWFNINGNKDYNIPHNHPESIFSGVYYVKTLPDCGNIVFEHPALDVIAYAHFNLKFNEWNSRNTHTWWHPAQENMMYIFPSWLKHCVEPNLSPENRISISFNCIGQ